MFGSTETKDMLRYMKYADNILLKEGMLGKLDIEKERYLLVSEIDDEFEKFLEAITPQLIQIIKELGK